MNSSSSPFPSSSSSSLFSIPSFFASPPLILLVNELKEKEYLYKLEINRLIELNNYKNQEIDGLKNKLKECQQPIDINIDVDKPSRIEHYQNGNVRHESYKINDIYHREGDKPAYIEYYENGNLKYELYFINGNYHREGDKPAYIDYYKNGNVKYESYYINGIRHRGGDKPACIKYYKNGNVRYESYYINGKRHREENKPHKIDYSEDGNIITEKWMGGEDGKTVVKRNVIDLESLYSKLNEYKLKNNKS